MIEGPAVAGPSMDCRAGCFSGRRPGAAASGCGSANTERRIAEGDADVPIPPGVRAVIGQRLRQLSEPCLNLLVAASVMGREFGLEALARLGDVPRNTLLDLLDEAMAERVVSDVPGSPGRLRFGHALIRDTLYDELTGPRRLRLHQRAGEALEAVYAADLEPHLAELARHFFAAAPAGVADKQPRGTPVTR
jgi:predicted ATPase